MRISVITFGELAEGYEDPAAPALEELIAPYGIVEIVQSIARRYAVISRVLRSSGSRWGDNDLWIGATALDVAEPLVTRDRERRTGIGKHARPTGVGLRPKILSVGKWLSIFGTAGPFQRNTQPKITLQPPAFHRDWNSILNAQQNESCSLSYCLTIPRAGVP